MIQKPSPGKEALEKVASYVARQQVMEGSKLASVGGSNIYLTKAGWECEQIKADPNVTKVISVLQLEAAVQDPNIATIFVPTASALTLDMAERVLARNGLDKTLFWEA